MARDEGSDHMLTLFLTRCSEAEKIELVEKMGNAGGNQRTVCGRINHKALVDALGPVQERQGVVVYVCGTPSMTDDFVGFLKWSEGMEEKRVLCEKWW